MRAKHTPPGLNVKSFNCPYCGAYAKQEWAQLVFSKNTTEMRVSICAHCQKHAYWHGGNMVVPSEAPVEPAHPDLPEDCKADYNEARDIFTRSPRAAAALLRLCIQKLMPHLNQKGKNINEDIAALVKAGLPALVQKALDICRVVGNNAVHPGEIDLNDSPEVAQNLFEMINFIVDQQITQPRELQTLYGTLPQSARDAIEKRDSGKTATP